MHKGENYEEIINELNIGKLRVATQKDGKGEWEVQEWIKKAILLYSYNFV